MQAEDMREVDSGATLETDLAIVGSGPAGLTLARELIGSNVRVLILESGELREAPAKTALNKVENVGALRKPDPRDVRNRVLGGSSHTWAGRCRTFDDIDFEHRPWVPHSGWPIDRSSLEPYMDRAAALMRLGPNVYDARLWRHIGRKPSDGGVRSDALDPCFWQYARSQDHAQDFMRFGPEFLRLTAPNVRIFTNATVTQIVTDDSGRKLKSLEVASSPDKRMTVKPRIVALCAGGIENARLLLASSRICSMGVGNGNGLVGRFLMDHPRTTLGEYTPEADRIVQACFGLFQLRSGGATHFYAHGRALSAELQREERLLNCAAFLSEHRAQNDPWDALKRLSRRESPSILKDAMAVVSAPWLLLEGARRRWIDGRNVTHKLERLAVDCLVEQVPEPDSRLTLGHERDAYGMPIARIDWRISDLERRSVLRLAQLFASETARLGLPPPRPADWVRDNRPDLAVFTDMAHPTGTTRMADDPTGGVVDRNCRLHGVEGVYVAGSSVFPTAGHANPTLMIVALAVRLADWLKERHFRRVPAREMAGA